MPNGRLPGHPAPAAPALQELASLSNLQMPPNLCSLWLRDTARDVRHWRVSIVRCWARDAHAAVMLRADEGAGGGARAHAVA